MDPNVPIPPPPSSPPPLLAPAPPSSPPPFVAYARPRRGLSRLAWAAIAVGAVLLLGLVAGGVFTVTALTAAASDHRTARNVLESARGHNDEIYSQLQKNASFNGAALAGSTPDFASFRDDMRAYSTKLTASSATVATDLGRLRSEDARLRDHASTPLGALSRIQYAGDEKRVEAMISAFGAAGGELVILHTQIDYFAKLADALDAFQIVTVKADGNDVQGALDGYTRLNPAMQAVVGAAGDPDIAPQFKHLTSGMKTVVGDYKTALIAMQSKDSTATKAALDQLQSAIDSIGAFDETGFETWEQNLLQPYRTQYATGIKDAGFTLT
jgi:hypothetical protein